MHFDTMTCIDYAASFVKSDDEDPIERQMDEFLKKEVAFDDMPMDIRGWKQNSKIQVQGHRAIKTVTRKCRLKDGTEKELIVTQEREFDL